MSLCESHLSLVFLVFDHEQIISIEAYQQIQAVQLMNLQTHEPIKAGSKNCLCCIFSF